MSGIRDAAKHTGAFVLYVGLVAPYFPLVAPEEFFKLYPLDRIPESKLHPKTGYQRHPWVQAYADFMRNEESFKSEEERLQAFAGYFGLVSFLDHNVGQIVQALRETDLEGDTTVIYTSDHGDNLGARGLWGKSTLYQESVGVPMIVAGPDIRQGESRTPVDLLDLFPTILQGAGIDPKPHMGDRPGKSLFDVAAAPADGERVVFSEYHAAGSNTAAFMVRKGRWKYHYYVRFEPELFDVDADPEELVDLAADAAYAPMLREMEAELRRICDPEAVDAMAKHDQLEMIERLGGLEAASKMGSGGATPAPAVH